jgi:sensor histidine kinase regulating citrate/malate metabolism
MLRNAMLKRDTQVVNRLTIKLQATGVYVSDMRVRTHAYVKYKG